MKLYFLLNILVISVPLLISFEPRVAYYRKWRYLFPSILFVGVMFLSWDVLAVSRGDWRFNPAYLTGGSIAGIPFEEALFFVTVPYSCIFIFEIISYACRDRIYNVPSAVFYFVAGLLSLGAIIFRGQGYTRIVLALCALSVVAMAAAKPQILKSRNYWIFILVTFVPFSLVNSILTSAPVVIYSPSAIWGIRVFTIPLEDFFYSYTLLSLVFLVYACLQDFDRQRAQLRKLYRELSQTRRML